MFAKTNKPFGPLDVVAHIPARNWFPGESVATKFHSDLQLGSRDPIRSLTPPTPASKTPYIKNGQFPNGTSITRDRNVSAPAVPYRNYDAAANAGIGVLSAASLAAPAILPFAAAAGIGYGTYKLGQALSIW